MEDCSNVILSGELAILPTETVYGLCALACDALAVDKIFKLKGRPPNNPLIAHILESSWLNAISEPSPVAFKLGEFFWPGPLTIGLPKKNKIPLNVSAGLPTVAIRSPAHPAFRKVLEIVNQPIAAPSANLSNRVSPTTIEHVIENFGTDCPPVFDGGRCKHGLESTVLDLSENSPRILRPGPISLSEIENALGTKILEQSNEFPGGEVSQKSPGNLKIHYAPQTPLKLFQNLSLMIAEQENMINQIVLLPSLEKREEFTVLGLTTLLLSKDGNPRTIARNLYHVLQKADKLGKEKMNICLLSGTEDLIPAINDRLVRASNK